MRNLPYSLSIIILIGLTAGYNSQELKYSLMTNYGEFKYSTIDTGTVKDLINICDKKIPEISAELNIDFDNTIVIELFPDQESYNASIINPSLRNSPAISGNARIQMVSPLAPLEAEKQTGIIKYGDRLYFIVHEYVHILMDKLESPPPLCLDEGIACYYSSREFYSKMAARYVKQINYIPPIDQLISDYDKVPAPDLFSFLLIDYIEQNKGQKAFSDLIRHPDGIVQMNDEWVDFMKKTYY